MKKHFFFFLLLVSLTLFSQEKEAVKSNPIIFVDITGGISYIRTLNASVTINYQSKNNLFTYRYSELYHIKSSYSIWEKLFPFLLFFPPKKSEEHAFLYGKRFINNDFSYSFSGGISYTKYIDNPILLQPINYDNFFWGFPFEVNVKWFKPKKERIKIYGLIPVGKPTIFGFSTGVKLFGNISKQSYIGIGLTFGLGYYKNY